MVRRAWMLTVLLACVSLTACRQTEREDGGGATPEDAGGQKPDGHHDAGVEDAGCRDAGSGLDATPRYEPTAESLAKHPLPPWYQDAKLGIMITWGLYSVPAWAPLTGPLNEVIAQEDGWTKWFAANPYAEWYYNSMRVDGGPTAVHHAQTYGAQFPYSGFRPMFEEAAQSFDADSWAQTFANAGARYVVLVTKHHDGFCLWPTSVPHPTLGTFHSQRDYVGELAQAVRAHGMRFGVYYSGGIDWTFKDVHITGLALLLTATPQTQDYIDYAQAQWRELIDRYQPAVLWDDMGYPSGTHAKEVMAYYYNQHEDGVVNDRFGFLVKDHHDFMTAEYDGFQEVQEKKWEATRGMGWSFGYNRQEAEAQTVSAEELIHLVIDVTAKNGNLLLNVGPQASGVIPELQLSRLTAVGTWMQTYGGAIYGTRPWTRATGETTTGLKVRFTRTETELFVFLLGVTDQSNMTVRSLVLNPSSQVSLLGATGAVGWEQQGEDVQFSLPAPLPVGPAVVLRISPVP